MKNHFAVIPVVLMITGMLAHGDVSGKPEIPEFPESPAVPAIDDITADVRDAVLSYFEPAEGEVTAVEDGRVTIRLHGEKQAVKGMRFSVFRKGDPFYHPVTNELLGYTENAEGRIEVRDTVSGGGQYVCSIIKGDIRTGDVARISSSKVKLAFFQDKKADWAFSESFYASIKNSGRFEILEAFTPGYEPETLAQKARELGAEAVMMFSTPVKEKKRYITVKLYWSHDAGLIDKIEDVVSRETVEKLTPEDEFVSASLTQRDPWASYKIPAGQLIARGDVDDNGVKELIVSDGHDIRVYNLKPELQEVWLVEGETDETHLSLDILDVNGNGMAEIFVTTLIDGTTPSDATGDSISGTDAGAPKYKSRIKSFILEYSPEEGYRRIKRNLPYFFRVMGSTLLMQEFGSANVFGGTVYEGTWRDGHYKPAKPVRLPIDANIYGFTFVDWLNSGRIHTITFDDQGYLFLYDDRGDFLWRSSQTYGKSELSFREKSYSVLNPELTWSVRGDLVTVKTEHGQEVLVVKRIPIVSRVPGLGAMGAEVYSLRWDGSEMIENMVLSRVSGSVTDYLLEKGHLFLIARGSMLSFVKNAATGEFSKGSMLYYFNVGAR